MRFPTGCLLFLASLALAGEPRSWTDTLGRTIQATMEGLEDGKVLLRLENGKRVPYPIEKLSEQDAEFARNHAAALRQKDPVPNFADPWPDRIRFSGDPEIQIVEEDKEHNRFVYESANYRYVCDVRLSKSVVKGFAVMFEATYLFCRTLPLGLDGGRRIDGKLQIVLFEQYDKYIRQGGPPGSAGVFLGNEGIVMVPLTSLGVRPVGSGYMLDRKKSNSTLPHELTHQLTPHAYFTPGAIGWFSEGIAEYVAVTPYRSGTYTIRNNHDDIVEYVTRYGEDGKGGRMLGDHILISDLEDFLLQDYAGFQTNPNFNYGVSLLLTYYFLQMDGEGDAARIKKYLQALREGTKGRNAVAILLDGRSYEELGKDISKAWGRRGIDITIGGGN